MTASSWTCSAVWHRCRARYPSCIPRTTTSSSARRDACQHAGAILGCASGHPGLGTPLPGLLSERVNRGRIDLGTVARMQARAAQLFALPSKGAIRPGSDADLVLVNLDLEREAHGAEFPS